MTQTKARFRSGFFTPAFIRQHSPATRALTNTRKPTTEENWANSRNGDNPNSLPVETLYSEESPAQTLLTVFQEGGAEAFKDTWYWSSSQRSADSAFYMDFDDGGQYTGAKGHELRVRPVRSQLID